LDDFSAAFFTITFLLLFLAVSLRDVVGEFFLDIFDGAFNFLFVIFWG
jgi:hypothetical protein